MTDLQAIVDRLTDAQKGVILGFNKYPRWQTHMKLLGMKLMTIESGVLVLTDLGLAVRKLLEKQND